MNDKDIKKFAQEILNTSRVRDLLRQRVSQIDRLESLDSLHDLRLTKMYVEEDMILMADYEGIATTDLYPQVRTNLMRLGIIGKNNVIGLDIANKGQSDEYETLLLGFSGNRIQVVLKAYNPKYRV